MRLTSLLLLLLACTPEPDEGPGDLDRDGWIEDDCAPEDPQVHPGAQERCNGVDDDCDGNVDEDAIDAQTWYADADGDDFGDPEVPWSRCDQPPDFVSNDLDCDDTDPAVNPYADEVCNGIDDDCDGEADVMPTWYEDRDGDGWGDVATEACERPDGHVADGGDCDDDDDTTWPGAPERCDDLDNDCDGEVDEGAGTPWCPDADHDGYGDPDGAVIACDDPGEGWLADCTDCDDTSAAVYPGNPEDHCDGEDNDCDGDVDEDHKTSWILITGTSTGFSEVDPTTGALTELSEYDWEDSLSITSTDVREDGLAIMNDNSASQILSFDACDGTVDEIGTHDLGQVGGITFVGGALYAIDSDADTLESINPSTGVATRVGGLGTDFGYNGMAWDCANDVLYAVNARDEALYELDPATGAATLAMATTASFGVVGLEYDATRQVLWASTGSGFYELDPAAGTTTSIATFSESLNDLALYPACP